MIILIMAQLKIEGSLISQSYRTPIILYDGECMMCNTFIQSVIRLDDEGAFRFKALQEQSLINDQSSYTKEKQIESIVLIHNGQYFIYSSAVLGIFRLLGGPYKVISYLRYIPPMIRDSIYKIIARYRYSFSKRSRICFLPSSEIKKRFL